MQDIEEMQDVDKDIKIPNEIGEEEYGQEEEGDSDMENEVFALARENQEMEGKQETAEQAVAQRVDRTYANQEMIEKINKIENEMMDDKKW